MTQKYERILIAIDGSYESELAVEKGIMLLFVMMLNYC